MSSDLCGILLLDKPKDRTSFTLVAQLRRLTGIKKIGHAGTLDPFATGVMVMLIGKQFTRLSDQFLSHDKAYRATLHFGITTDSYDCDGCEVARSPLVPSLTEIEHVLMQFQGTLSQTPPMFSAKKIQGKKLYELARKGITIERKPVEVHVKTTLVSYDYPHLVIDVECTKGTYIRSIGHEIGQLLKCGAHLSALMRTRSGPFSLPDCISLEHLNQPLIKEKLLHSYACCHTD